MKLYKCSTCGNLFPFNEVVTNGEWVGGQGMVEIATCHQCLRNTQALSAKASRELEKAMANSGMEVE